MRHVSSHPEAQGLGQSLIHICVMEATKQHAHVVSLPLPCCLVLL
jgi:hypothetical protein